MRSRSPTVTVAAILLVLLSLFDFPWLYQLLFPGAIGAIEPPAFLIYSGYILGIVGIVIAIGLLLLNKWSYWATIVVCVLNFLSGAPGVVMAPGGALKAVIVVGEVVAVLIIVLVVLPPSRRALSVSPNPNWFVFALIVITTLCFFVVLVLSIQYVYLQWISQMYKLPKSGLFGDTFGAVTAFFTGVGFLVTATIILFQLEDIRRREKERSDTEEHQRRVTTMSMVYNLENEFGSERMRELRHKACEFFLHPRERGRPTLEDEVAVRDTLYFLERVAHFTNEELVDDDLVLSVFGSRLLMYWKCTNENVQSLEQVSSSSLRLPELKRLCDSEQTGIKGWLRSVYGDDGDDGDAVIAEWYNERELRSRLQREHLRTL